MESEKPYDSQWTPEEMDEARQLHAPRPPIDLSRLMHLRLGRRLEPETKEDEIEKQLVDAIIKPSGEVLRAMAGLTPEQVVKVTHTKTGVEFELIAVERMRRPMR